MDATSTTQKYPFVFMLKTKVAVYSIITLEISFCFVAFQQSFFDFKTYEVYHMMSRLLLNKGYELKQN